MCRKTCQSGSELRRLNTLHYSYNNFLDTSLDCKLLREAISARWFIAKRKALENNRDLEPALRKWFIELVDRAEHERKLVPLQAAILAGTLGDGDQFVLRTALRALVGPVIDPRIASSDVFRDTWL